MPILSGSSFERGGETTSVLKLAMSKIVTTQIMGPFMQVTGQQRTLRVLLTPEIWIGVSGYTTNT